MTLAGILHNRPTAVLIRIVRMTFHPDALDTFLQYFDAAAPKIRAFPGCTHLELWEDAQFANVCTTYSHWQSTEALQEYRESDLFRSTWADVKPLFAAPPEAYSCSPLRSVDPACHEADHG